LKSLALVSSVVLMNRLLWGIFAVMNFVKAAGRDI
jgi:hypothetical protein